MTVTHTILRGDDEIDIKVEVKIWPASRGYRDKYGCPEEPDTEAEVEILSVTDDIELTDDEINAIEIEAFEQAADNAMADAERRAADAKEDRERDRYAYFCDATSAHPEKW